MPEQKRQTVYVGGEEPSVVELRQRYQDALERLSKSLETRQQRTFDPRLLGAASAFLTPSSTGSFFESLGRAAQAYSGGEERLQKEEQDIARQQMEAASAGLEVERQRQSDLWARNYLGMNQPQMGPSATLGARPSPAAPIGGVLTTGAASSAAPTGGLPAAPVGSALTPAAPKAAPMGGLAAAQPEQAPQYGVQVMNPNPGLPTGADYLRFAVSRGEQITPEHVKTAQEMDSRLTRTVEGGTVNLRTGIWSPFKPEQVETTIYGYGGKPSATVKVPSELAIQLNQALLKGRATGDMSEYNKLREFIENPARAAQAIAQGAAPAQVAAAPTETAGIRPSETETKTAAAAQEALQKGRAEAAVKSESEQEQKAASARNLFPLASQIDSLVKKNDPAFGYFNQPGMLPALGRFIAEKGGRLDAADQFVAQRAARSDTEEQLRARALVARNLGQMALEYAKLFLTGQGSVSDNERRLVAQIPGNLTDDPKTLQDKMKLIKMRAQYEIDNHQKWQEFQENNPDKSIADYRRSKAYNDALNDYDKKLGKTFGFEPAVPTSQKPPKTEQVRSANERLKKLWSQ